MAALKLLKLIKLIVANVCIIVPRASTILTGNDFTNVAPFYNMSDFNFGPNLINTPIVTLNSSAASVVGTSRAAFSDALVKDSGVEETRTKTNDINIGGQYFAASDFNFGHKNSDNKLNDAVFAPPPAASSAAVLLHSFATSIKDSHFTLTHSPTSTAQKRQFVRSMMKHAWKGYAENAFGENEVDPRRKGIYSPSIYGGAKLGATIVDALDTLWIMGFRDEFNTGRKWIFDNFHLSNVDTNVTVFEISIRFLGGLLSASSLSGDEALLQKATELGRILLDTFNTPTGLPRTWYNFKRNHSSPESGVPLAECGTFHLEFAYLSTLTGDRRFVDKATRIRTLLDKIDKPDGLYLNSLNVDSGGWDGERVASVGAYGDSFYEYLLKVWLWSNKTDTVSKRMFDSAMQAVENKLVMTSHDKHVYIGQIRNGVFLPKMDHLSCFMGGLYALGAPYAANTTLYAMRAEQIADTCHFTYNSTRTGLGPDVFTFHEGIEGKPWANERGYFLRPELVETYFVLWRKTKDPIYRQWGWDVAQAIEKHCRAEAGYAGLLDVNAVDPSRQDDVQQSFFLAETLKYLYLLFVDEIDGGKSSTAADDGGVDISLDDYVFNTEAHPIPIFGGRRYPKSVPNINHRLYE